MAFWVFCGAALQMSYQRNSWDQNDGLYIGTDEIRARDSGGLKLYNDAGSGGAFVSDVGEFGIGSTTLYGKLHVENGTEPDIILYNNDGGAEAKGYRVFNDYNALWFQLIDDDFSETPKTFFKTTRTGFQLDTTEMYGDILKFGLSDGTEKVRIDVDGDLGVGTNSPTQKLDVNSDSIRIRVNQSPASSDACDTGEIAWDSSYIYVCTSSGAWKRAALTGGY